MIDDGQKAGSCFQGDLNRAGEVKVRHDSVSFHGQNPKKAQKPQDSFAISHKTLENSADFVHMIFFF